MQKKPKKPEFSSNDVNNFWRSRKSYISARTSWKYRSSTSFFVSDGYIVSRRYISKKWKKWNFRILAIFPSFLKKMLNNEKNAKIHVLDFSFFEYIVLWDSVAIRNRKIGRLTIFWNGWCVQHDFAHASKIINIAPWKFSFFWLFLRFCDFDFACFPKNETNIKKRIHGYQILSSRFKL